ncbi:MAG: 23S rRNA (adenine(2503)-C(2))-methyltransferase RlmN [Candidatus Euphemobacter frigidus]|nr:23S rRNA (adenine(2503)-C(2))-methyltransferase RlmN [Candidatus Euphemobacter frigidus]MDP8276727.1 23S rRNA (adenine(2503)-C(2))-methyltransferase RlmN [Candidatus Euphemobacter frigidus]
MNLGRLNNILEQYPPYRSRQAYSVVFDNLFSSWEEATNLPKAFRAILARECPLQIDAEMHESGNGKTVKAVIQLDDGVAIETVLMRHQDGRNTVCVSSQAGCSLACDFCLTGARGFMRDLTAGEIVGQVLLFARRLKTEGERVKNVVFMGMGEPFLNYEAVMKAIRLMNNRDGLKIGARRISISTVGIIEGIRKLSREPLQLNLSISLHAPDDRLRSRLMPVNRQYPIEKILDAVAEYIRLTRRRVMIEYLLLRDLNDSPAAAERLAVLLRRSLGWLFFVNLIYYNPTGKYLPSPPERIREFQRILESRGISVTRRYRFGREIKAACGQLAGSSRIRGSLNITTTQE